MDVKTLKDIIKTRKDIKEKFQSLKQGESDANIFFEKTFSPITKPLNKIFSDSTPKIKIEKHEGDVNKVHPIKSITPIKKNTLKKWGTERKLLVKNEESSEDERYFSEASDTDSNEKDEDITLENSQNANTNVSLHIEELTKLEENGKLDTLYGPNRNSDGSWRFGDSSLYLTNEKIHIGNKSYLITPGLYQLLFYKNPKYYDRSELDVYEGILLDTNALRRNFKSNEQIKGTRASKYTNIIKKILENKSKSPKKKS